MNSDKTISERLGKFFIAINYQNETYYTVSGNDMTTFNYEDKLLTDENKMLVLFKDLVVIRQVIANKLFLFDDERLIEWAAGIDDELPVYATINLDIYLSDDIRRFNDAVLEEIYLVNGIVTDYAKQVEDDFLIDYLYSDLFGLFFDIASDSYLWGARKVFDADFDYETFSAELRNCYNYLKTRIRIYE
jgi:hypothetical protein